MAWISAGCWADVLLSPWARAVTFSCAVLVAGVRPGPAQSSATPVHSSIDPADAQAPLQSAIQQIAQPHHGSVALLAQQLNTGKQLALGADTLVQTASTIPSYLDALDSTETGSGIASKTGSLNATRSDVALIAVRSGPIVLAVYTHNNADKGWSVDNEGELTITKIARAVVAAWSPQGIDGKLLVPGLGLRNAPANATTTAAHATAAGGTR